MSVREIRRESFEHGGRAYDVVVTDDGKRLIVVAQREGKTMRGGRFAFPPHGWQGYTAVRVDEMVDDAKRWILERAIHPWTPMPLERSS